MSQKYDAKDSKNNCVVGAGDKVLRKNFELSDATKVQT